MAKSAFAVRRVHVLLAVALALAGVLTYPLVGYYRLADYALQAEAQGARLHGELASASTLERLLRDELGIYPARRFERLFVVDLRPVADSDLLLSSIPIADEVVCVKLGTGVRDVESLRNLRQLPLLTDVVIDAPDADEAWFSHSASCSNLRRVSIRRGRVTDRGLEVLARIRSLRALRIPDSQVTDAGVASLAGLTALVELDLRGSAITDASVPALIGLPKLEDLNVVRTGISAAGAEKLRAGGVRRVLW